MSSESIWEAFQGKFTRAYFAIVLFALMGTAYYYYFYRVPGKALDENFYKSFPLNERRITSADIKDVLDWGKGTEFRKMAVDAAFLRYRLDSGNTGVFDKFVQSYQQGIWDVPAPAEWKTLFEEHVKKWETARAEFIKTGGIAPQAGVLPQGQVLHIGYKESSTAMLGTRIDVLVSLPEGFNPNAFAEYKVHLNGIDLPVPRIAYWKMDKYSTGTQGTLSLDVGLEPVWFVTDKRLGEIQIHCSGLPQWQVLDIRYN